MRFWVGLTDYDWFTYLASLADVDEVNFWQPSAGRKAVDLPVGAPFLFKLHADEGGWIVGGGTILKYERMTARFAWEAFENRNGAVSIDAMKLRIERYRGSRIDVETDEIGAFILLTPFFLPRDLWVAPPAVWARNIVQGKTYESTEQPGAALWVAVERARAQIQPTQLAEQSALYGAPTLVQRRLGQGAFRVLVTDAYDRRCAITGERTLPVLEAAHIRPYSQLGPHALDNGLLLRSDLHTLFDRGYVTVTPDLTVRVSRTIREEWENGRDYYALDRRPVAAPIAPNPVPSRDYLEWHADVVFRG